MSEEVKLEVGGVYKTNVQDLVKIKEIDEQKGKIHLYNITESCNQWVNLVGHRLKERIR